MLWALDKQAMKLNRRLFIICWEFPGFNSRQGTALSKRAGALADGFSSFHENIIVITRNHFTSEYKIENNVHLIPGANINAYSSFFILRKALTLLYSIFIGDRSGLWGYRVFKYVSGKFVFTNEDVIVSFFTPRGTVLAGYLLTKKYSCKWVVDFQDTFDEGLSEGLRPFGGFWFRKILKLASACVHVSPEWAARDGHILNKDFHTIRHSLPALSKVGKKIHPVVDHEIKLLYYGSFDARYQYHSFFFNFLKTHTNYLFLYAGDEKTDAFFQDLNLGDRYFYLGWIPFNELIEVLENVDYAIVFSYTSLERMVVPSKLYEVISLEVPCIIVGRDSGGIKNLEQEFNFTFVKATNQQELESVLKNPVDFPGNYLAFSSLSQNSFVIKYFTLIEQL